MHFVLFCCKISLLSALRYLVAKSVLSRFTHFGVEKIWAKNVVCGKKRTNIRYAPADRPITEQQSRELTLHCSSPALYNISMWLCCTQCLPTVSVDPRPLCAIAWCAHVSVKAEVLIDTECG